MITFAATPDTYDDDNESIRLGFGTLPTGVSAGTPDETTVNITDDDVPSITASFEQSSYTVAESDDASTTGIKENEVTVKVTLSAAPERRVLINLFPTHQDGATLADYDFVPGCFCVDFSRSETQATITFTIKHDTIDDDGESVRITMASLPAGVNFGSNRESMVNITDDDDPEVTVSYQASSYTVSESDDPSTTNVKENEVAIKVVLSADPERTVEIPVSASPQGGAFSSDYSLAPTRVTFNPGETQKTLILTATQDRQDDDNESVLLTFGVLPDGVTPGTTDEATVSITDDDTAPTAADGTVTTREGRTYTFTEGEFGYADGDGDALASVKITRLPTTGRGTMALDGTTIDAAHLPKTVTQAELSEMKLKYTPPGSGSGTGYTNFTFRVNDGSNDSAQSTMTISITPRNLAGNLDSPQAVVFLTSIIDETVGIATSYMHYWAI